MSDIVSVTNPRLAHKLGVQLMGARETHGTEHFVVRDEVGHPVAVVVSVAEFNLLVKAAKELKEPTIHAKMVKAAKAEAAKGGTSFSEAFGK